MLSIPGFEPQPAGQSLCQLSCPVTVPFCMLFLLHCVSLFIHGLKWLAGSGPCVRVGPSIGTGTGIGLSGGFVQRVAELQLANNLMPRNVSSVYTWHTAGGTQRCCVLDVYMAHSRWHTTLLCPRCILGTLKVAQIVIVSSVYTWHTAGGTQPWRVLDVYMAHSRWHMLLFPRYINGTQRVAHNLDVS